MSEVKVNKISPRSGTSLTIGDSGDTTNIVGTLQNNGAALVGDISSVVAGTNLSGGGTSGDVTLNLADASTSAKGAASFSSDNFAASSGAVTIKDAGIATAELQDNAVTTAKITDANVTTAKIADDAVTADKLDNSINSAITANTAKVTNATHSGEVTGSGALTIADNVVDEANLKVSNSPTNGYFLAAQSGNTGGLTWQEAGGGGSWTLLNTQTVSNAATLDFESIISNTYNLYAIHIFDFNPASTNKILRLQGSENNGSSYNTSNYHYHVTKLAADNTSYASYASTSSSGYDLSDTVKSDNIENFHGLVYISSDFGAAYQPKFWHQAVTKSGATNGTVIHMGAGMYNGGQSSATNAFRLVFSSGNISSGTATIYGIAKS